MGKDFKNKIGSKRMDSLIPPDPMASAGSESSIPPVKEEAKASSPTTVATFRVNTDRLMTLKALAFWDRKKIQEVLDEALNNYFDTISPTALKKAKEEFSKRNNK